MNGTDTEQRRGGAWLIAAFIALLGMTYATRAMGQQAGQGEAHLVCLSGCVILEEGTGDRRARAAALSEIIALNDRVRNLSAQGRNLEALPIAEQTLRMSEATLGRDNYSIATVLDSLASVYFATGRYGSAIPLLERAVHIRVAALGPDTPEAAPSLSTLGLVYYQLRQYQLAIPLFARALRMQETALGPDHIEVGTSLNNLALVYDSMGQYTRALPLYERALRIEEAALGPEHPKVADGLNNLAETFVSMGQFERAISLHERALHIREVALGATHPSVAVSLNNLAEVYVALGQYERALPLHERALRIREAALGRDHPYVAITLNNLSTVYSATGRYDRANALLERATRIYEQAVGSNHPDVAVVVDNRALLYRAMGRFDQALPLHERALRILAREMVSIGSHEREGGVVQFLDSMGGRADELISLAIERASDTRARALGLQAALLFKARGQEESAATLAALRASPATEDQAALARWQSASLRLAALRSDSVTERPQRERLETELTAAEEELARRSSVVRDRRRLGDVDALIPSVARRLARDAALVEIVAFKPLHATVWARADRWGAQRYAAFVLFGDDQHAVVDLGEAAPIDAAARALLDAAAHPGADGDLAPVTRAGQALERLLFTPMRAQLHADTRRLILAPDGPLHLAPLHLMHDGQRFFVDRYTISYVTSGRDLLRERETPPQATPPTMVAVTHYPVADWDRGGLRMQAAAMPALIPGVRLLTGEHATEHELRALQAPTLLHIAAHGVFEGDVGGDDPQRGAMQRGRLLMADVRPDLSTPTQGDDGQVTASEVLTMNLRGTRLVVLSACETGRGNATVGQGVFGLRRAFLLAGAEALVTALWNVDDELAVRFMEVLYRGLRAGRRSADALAEAIAAVRRVDPHPYAWAPFVLVGRDDVIDLGAAQMAGRSP